MDWIIRLLLCAICLTFLVFTCCARRENAELHIVGETVTCNTTTKLDGKGQWGNFPINPNAKLEVIRNPIPIEKEYNEN